MDNNKVQNNTEILQLVTFKIGNEEFGFDIFKVREINKMVEITEIPNAKSGVKGIINLRGKVIPILSLREKLNLAEDNFTNKTRIIVIEHEGKDMGFIVDEVNEVLRIESLTIEAPPEMATNINSDFITGVAKLEQRLLILLNLNKLLAGKEKI